MTLYTCAGCLDKWSGVSRAHCSGCHCTFAGVRSFDLHRKQKRGEGVCVDPATLVNAKQDGKPYLVYRDGLWRSADEFNGAGDLFGAP